MLFGMAECLSGPLFGFREYVTIASGGTLGNTVIIPNADCTAAASVLGGQ